MITWYTCSHCGSHLETDQDGEKVCSWCHKPMVTPEERWGYEEGQAESPGRGSRQEARLDDNPDCDEEGQASDGKDTDPQTGERSQGQE